MNQNRCAVVGGAAQLYVMHGIEGECVDKRAGA
jgi:hypothetical protein